jgi:intracellular sulfur oxidation DsrE/DsrF family protein
MKLILFPLFLSIILININFAQEKSSGPIINDFGEVYKVENPDIIVDPTQDYKAVFDVGSSPKEHVSINKSIETGARFLNMHAQAGVPKEKIKVALVLHGSASKDVLTNKAYNKKYGIDNPNIKLINALTDAGVQVILCGQSAAYNTIKKEDMIPSTKLSLSAMTALVLLQNQDYRLIKF